MDKEHQLATCCLVGDAETHGLRRSRVDNIGPLALKNMRVKFLLSSLTTVVGMAVARLQMLLKGNSIPNRIVQTRASDASGFAFPKPSGFAWSSLKRILKHRLLRVTPSNFQGSTKEAIIPR